MNKFDRFVTLSLGLLDHRTPTIEEDAMNVCPHCHHQNRPGVIICTSCGHFMIKNGTGLETRQVTATSPLTVTTRRGTSHLSPHQTAYLRVNGSAAPVTLHPSKRIAVLGRADTHSPSKPDIDLSAYGGYKMGVSRTHAHIFRSHDTLMIMDKGSANGTYLNGQPLLPNEPRILRDGDEIRLGQLVMKVFFS